MGILVKRRGIVDALRGVFRRAAPNHEFTLNSLIEKTNASSVEEVALALAVLTKNREVKRLVRVESPYSHMGLGDFSSVQEVPERMYDAYSEREVRVDPSDLVVLFKKMSNEERIGRR
jgi:hypothetical protein